MTVWILVRNVMVKLIYVLIAYMGINTMVISSVWYSVCSLVPLVMGLLSV